MRNKLEKIAKQQVNKLIKRKDVLGILVFGSLARGGVDKYSDIDIYVLLSKKPKFSRQGKKENGIIVDIQLDDKKVAYESINEEKFKVRRNFSHMIAMGKIVYDTSGEMKKLQVLAKSNLRFKTKMSNQEKIMHLYSIDDFYGEVLRYCQSDDDIAFRQNCELLVNNIIDFFLKLKGDYWRRPNEMKAVFMKHDKKFATLLVNYYKEADKRKIVKVLSALTERIYILAKTKLPNKWFI